MLKLKFAKDNLSWSTPKWNIVLQSDETNINLFDSDDCVYMRRPVGQRYNYKYQCPTIKLGVCNIMLWGCFLICGDETLRVIDGRMD